VGSQILSVHNQDESGIVQVLGPHCTLTRCTETFYSIFVTSLLSLYLLNLPIKQLFHINTQADIYYQYSSLKSPSFFVSLKDRRCPLFQGESQLLAHVWLTIKVGEYPTKRCSNPRNIHICQTLSGPKAICVYHIGPLY
jgi:hypothetical protein